MQQTKGPYYEPRRVLTSGNFKPMPTIVCLCGSIGFYMQAAEKAHGETWGFTSEQKIALDELHKRKIDLADEVLILNVGGYIGESTRSELEYAKSLGKPIHYLEPPDGAVEGKA